MSDRVGGIFLAENEGLSAFGREPQGFVNTADKSNGGFLSKRLYSKLSSRNSIFIDRTSRSRLAEEAGIRERPPAEGRQRVLSGTYSSGDGREQWGVQNE